jgi:hypothetical protein
MKKVAIGCLGVLVVCGIVAAGAAYYVYRQAKGAIATFAELGQIPEIERGLRVRGDFTPPVSGELTEQQLEQLLQVQTKVRERIGARFAEFQTRYKALSEKESANLADLPALIGAYRDMAAGWLDAKRGQVDALNEVNLSLEEYRWIRDEVYRAIGIPYVDLDLGAIAEDIRTGTTTPGERGQLRGSMGPAGPESNRKLVERFKKQLEDNVALASFGL